MNLVGEETSSPLGRSAAAVADVAGRVTGRVTGVFAGGPLARAPLPGKGQG